MRLIDAAAWASCWCASARRWRTPVWAEGWRYLAGLRSRSFRRSWSSACVSRHWTGGRIPFPVAGCDGSGGHPGGPIFFSYRASSGGGSPIQPPPSQEGDTVTTETAWEQAATVARYSVAANGACWRERQARHGSDRCRTFGFETFRWLIVSVIDGIEACFDRPAQSAPSERTLEQNI